MSPKNNAGVELDLSAIPAMIAHRIFLNFDSSFSDSAAKCLNNAKAERSLILSDPFNGNLHSRNFFTFGLSSIQYPTDQFLEISGYKLASNLIEEWHRQKEHPGDINTRTQGYLSSLKLSDDFLLGNKDFFGSQDFEPFQIEIDAIINSIRETRPESNIAPYLTKQLEMKEREFRGVGVADFYKNKNSNLNGALSEVHKLLTQRISDDLVDPDLGYGFCEKMLDEMMKIFTEKHKAFVDILNGLPSREKNSRESLNGFLSELTSSEDKIIFRDKALKDSMNKIGEAMKRNMEAKIGLRAYEFGIAFIKCFIEELKTQKENLKNWRDAVEKMKNEIDSEIRTRISSVKKKIENVKEFNGSLLFSEQKVLDLYHSLDRESAMNFIKKEALKNLNGCVLNLPDSNFNIDSVYKSGLDWLQDISVFKISETNVADKLLENYPDLASRRDIISQNYRKSIPFISIEASELNKTGFDFNYSTSAGTTNVGLVGLLNDEDGKLKNVKVIEGDIRKATDKHVEVDRISDKHQILFLQEYTAFPLRIIGDLKTLKEKYYQYIKSSKSPLPLHLSKHFDPPLMDLFLTTSQQIKEVQKAEENYLFGRAVGKITLETNAMQGYPEVRHRYLEAGSEKFTVLGDSWDAAFEKFKSDSMEIKNSRERLDKDLAIFLKGFETKIKRDELYYILDDLMREIKNSLDYKEENPLYKKYDEVRSRIVKNLKLYDESNPPDERNRKKTCASETTGKIEPLTASQKPGIVSASSSMTENEEKYITLVRTTLRNSKDGNLSQAMENMLKSNQKRYGLSDLKAAQINEAIRGELFGSPMLLEYEELLQAFMEDGEISEDERAILIERQTELGLTDEQVKKTETIVMERRNK